VRVERGVIESSNLMSKKKRARSNEVREERDIADLIALRCQALAHT
jgi:hypothetical protein